MSTPDTKERLLDVAERLFAEEGFADTSLRDITAAADANLASVNYHFGGKEGLLQAIFDRRLEPVNTQRLELLDAYAAAAAPAAPSPEQVLWAFLMPPFREMERVGEGGRHFLRIVGRMHSDPVRWGEFFERQFDAVAHRFHEGFATALPELERDEVLRRMHFLIGSMAHTFCWAEHMCPLGSHDADGRERTLHSLVRFAAAGMQAAATPLTVEEPVAAGDAPS